MRRQVIACTLLLAGTHAGDLQAGFAGALDLPADAAHAARLGVPVVLVVSRSDCEYCDWLRENILVPTDLDPSYAERAVIREVFLDGGHTFVDFDGVRRGTRVIAERYDAGFTPTVLFLDHRGSMLAAPMRGISSKDFYAFYFDRSIAVATESLRGRSH